jgi:hypothetical protein
MEEADNVSELIAQDESDGVHRSSRSIESLDRV